MSDKITAENLLHNLVDTLSDRPKKVSFFEEDKSKSVSSEINRLFGREKPVHHLLGGGKCMVFNIYTQFNIRCTYSHQQRILIFFFFYFGYKRSSCGCYVMEEQEDFC